MKAAIYSLIMVTGLFAQAQTKDSLDNIILKIPAGWQVQKYETYTEVTHFNKPNNSFCQLAVYKQQPASADLYASFKSEWEGLVLAFFETTATPVPVMRKTKAGNALYYGAQVINKGNNLPYYTELNVYDCGSNVQSVIVTTGAKKHFYDSLWQPLIVGVKKNGSATTATTTTTTTSSNSFNGRWARSSSSDNSPDPAAILTYAGYYKCEYNFKPDGTYTLHGEMRANDYTLIDESGSYKINGAQLILSPSTGKLRKLDNNGKPKSTQNLALSKRTYAWQTYYFEGLQETQLVLTPIKPYSWDGGAGGNSLFPNSILLSQEYKPEWKYK